MTHSHRTHPVWIAVVVLGFPLAALADATIAVDGDPSDWPADAFGFLDQPGDMPPPFADISEVRVTDDNTSGSNGSLYLGIDFESRFRPRVGSNDVDVFLYLDVDGDGLISGPADRVVELTEGFVTDGDGNLVGSVSAMDYDGYFMEASIPYSVLGLSHGSDTFGLAFGTSGKPDGSVDVAPEPGTGNGGFIIYDGAAGDGIEPLAVKLIGLAAVAGRRGVQVHWATGSERANAGFHVARLRASGPPVVVTRVPVPGLGHAAIGRNYHFADPTGRPGDAYLVADLEATGAVRWHGPVTAATEGASPIAVRSVRPKPLVGYSLRSRHRTSPGPHGTLVAARKPGLTRLEGIGGAATVRLERAGQPVPVIRDGDDLLFVGLPVNERHLDHDLLMARSGPAAVMERRRVRSGCGQPTRVATTRTVRAENRIYNLASPTADPFFWAWAMEGAPASVEFALDNPSSSPAPISLWLTGIAPSHRLAIRLNGTLLGNTSGEVVWQGQALTRVQLEVPASVLLDGLNQLELTPLTQPAYDIVYLEGLELEFQRRALLVGDQVTFEAPPNACVRLGGLTGDRTVLLDVTDPVRPILLRGFETGASFAGGGWLEFSDRGLGNKPRRYLVADLDRDIPAAEWGRDVTGRNLSSPRLRVDHLLITHPAFAAAAEALADLEATRGLRPMVVTTDEVFDAFDHGRPGPQAIREFVRTAAQSWASGPSFVLLLGGSTVDPNGFLPASPPDFVPSAFVKARGTGYEAVSDGWLTADAPGVAIGRLPIQTLAEAWQVVDKLFASEAALANPTGRLLFVADSYDPESADPTREFERAADRLIAACIPALGGLSAERLYKASSGDPQGELQGWVESGVDALHYLGHAFLGGWSSGPLMLDNQGASSLGNQRPFLSFSWSCFDGAFTDPWGESLAWVLVRNPTGGAVLASAASTLTDPEALAMLAEQVLCRLTTGKATTVGQAIQEAKDSLNGGSPALQDLLETYNLIGDPATPNPWATP